MSQMHHGRDAEQATPHFTLIDEDLYEEFYYPGSTEVGRKLAFKAGSVVATRLIQRYRDRDGKIPRSAVDEMVLAAAADTDPGYSPYGRIAGDHAGVLETFDPAAAATPVAAEPATYDEAGVQLTGPDAQQTSEPVATPPGGELAAGTQQDAPVNTGDDSPPIGEPQLGDDDTTQEVSTEQEIVEGAANLAEGADTATGDGPANQGLTDYDPTTKGVGEVSEYLVSASPAERERGIEAEKANRNRPGIVGKA